MHTRPETHFNESGRNKSARSRVQKRHGAAERRLPALETPRKTAELDALIEHLVDRAAEVLDVDHIVREQQRVHDLVVRLGEDVIKRTELRLRVLGLVG